MQQGDSELVASVVARSAVSEQAFAPELLAPALRRPSAIVVGLPRSGTKFLTHVMNHIAGLYVFDDLYYFREARGTGAREHLALEQFEHLLRWLAARSMPERRKLHLDRHVLEPADIERLQQAVRGAFRGREIPLHAPLEEWMLRLAMLNGCDRWGYKAPQDFMILDQIADAFPGARFLFIYRDPRSMMASYKFVPERFGDARQYHPIPYALYWRMAHRIVSEREAVLPIHRIKFEDLVREPRAAGRSIASFLGLPWREPRIPEKVNTSFDGRERSEITPTERWLCERIAGEAMSRAGYELGQGSLRLRDMPDLLLTSVRFALRQGSKALTSPRKRASAKIFLLRLLGRGDAPGKRP